MSQKLSDSKSEVQSNEEIIEELTKDLESQCIKIDENDASNLKDTKSEHSDDSFESTNENFDNDNASEENLEDDNAKKNVEIEDDYVDVEALKDLEVTLTPEEKNHRKNKSVELKNEGNVAFKEGKYLESLYLYTEGLNLCPLSFPTERSMLYSNRAASKAKLGRNESAIEDCTEAIQLNPNYIRALLRRAQLYEQTEKLDEALEDYKKILELDPSVPEARRAITTLPAQIEARNEKMKEEMIGKLKDLGNLFLKPFGLSTDNFQLQKDPKTGGYSVNFKQKQ